jgi:hypothetical protein
MSEDQQLGSRSKSPRSEGASARSTLRKTKCASENCIGCLLGKRASRRYHPKTPLTPGGRDFCTPQPIYTDVACDPTSRHGADHRPAHRLARPLEPHLSAYPLRA